MEALAMAMILHLEKIGKRVKVKGERMKTFEVFTVFHLSGRKKETVRGMRLIAFVSWVFKNLCPLTFHLYPKTGNLFRFCSLNWGGYE